MIKCFSKFITIFILIFLNVACAEEQVSDCNFPNINESLQCILGENKKLIDKLNNFDNSKKNDYREWKANIRIKCENKTRYSLGEGGPLAREKCLKDEYILRIKDISGVSRQEARTKKNDDGFLTTYLPYNSEDHLKCLLENNKKNCNKINLINISNLSKVYNFLDNSFGASVVLPESNNGLLIIVSPFSEESGENFINLAVVNSLGVVKNIPINASKNIIINNNYEVIFYKGNNKYKISLK